MFFVLFSTGKTLRMTVVYEFEIPLIEFSWINALTLANQRPFHKIHAVPVVESYKPEILVYMY